MATKLRAPICTAIAVALALTSSPSPAVVPVLLARQVIKEVMQRELKQHLASAFARSGCTGPHLAEFARSAGVPGAAESHALLGGALSAVSGGVMGKAGTLGSLTHAMQLPSAKGMPALVGGTGAFAFGAPRMLADNPQMQSAMAGLNEAAAHPLSHEESMKVFADLGSLGVLNANTLAEAQGCLAAAGPQGERSLGTAAAFLKSTVLPSLMDAKARFASLTPQEQSELADQVAEELRQTPAKERQEFLEGAGAGLFPEAVMQQVRAKLVK